MSAEEFAAFEAGLARFTAKDAGGIDKELGFRWFDAARVCDFVTMRDLFALTPQLVNYRGTGTTYGFIGSTALHWAAARGSEKVVLWLLKNGGDLDAQNNGGSTPLHSACANGQVNAAQLLLQAGCNITLVDCCGDLAVDVAQPQRAVQLRHAVRGFSLEAELRGTPPASWSVTSMKQALKMAGVPIAGITEKPELIAAVQDMMAAVAPPKMSPDEYASVEKRAAPDADAKLAVDSDDEDAEEMRARAEEAKGKGNEAYRSGDVKTSVKWYTLAIRLAPRHAVYYSNRSASYMSLEKFDLALGDAKKAIEIDPEWPKGHYRKGCALLQLGQAMDALWAFSTAQKLSPAPSADILTGLEHAKAAVKAAADDEDAAAGGSDDYDDDDDDGDDYGYAAYAREMGMGAGSSAAARAAAMQYAAAEAADRSAPARPKHDWFDCVLCENRTRDYAEMACCKHALCGTCVKRRVVGGRCPFACGK